MHASRPADQLCDSDEVDDRDSISPSSSSSRPRTPPPRTRGGEHGVGLITERRDGRVVALEAKLTTTVSDDDARHPRWLAGRVGGNLLDAAVITTGREAYRCQDGTGVIPA